MLALVTAVQILPGTTLTQPQDSDIYRAYSNIGQQVTASSKTFNTPSYTSVSKSDDRFSNNIPAGYHVAAVQQPALIVARPATYYGSGVATVAHHPANVASGAAASGGGLGVAYSIAPAVSHMSFSNGLGVSYSW